VSIENSKNISDDKTQGKHSMAAKFRHILQNSKAVRAIPNKKRVQKIEHVPWLCFLLQFSDTSVP
jgi:hypothetical protein